MIKKISKLLIVVLINIILVYSFNMLTAFLLDAFHINMSFETKFYIDRISTLIISVACAYFAMPYIADDWIKKNKRVDINQD